VENPKIRSVSILFKESSKMKKTKLMVAIVMGLIVVLLVAGAALAEDIAYVTYDDTAEVATGDFFDDYWFAPTEVGTGSLIRNGDFADWTNGVPDNWTVWSEVKSGWETAHLAQADLSLAGDGGNYGMGIFIRHIGGNGSFYAGAYQALDGIPADGYYWVNTHATSWGEKRTGYNAVAWYGIGDSDDPDSVSEWRTLDPFAAPCDNDWGVCEYIGRYETAHISPGQYFHLLATHKFPVFNAWTVFLFDDISIVPADGNYIEDGFWLDGAVGWNPNAPR
jgi:hypothetical protein